MDFTIIISQIHKYSRLLFLALLLPLITLFLLPQIGLLMLVPFFYLLLGLKKLKEAFIFGLLFGIVYFGTGFYWVHGQRLWVTLLGYFLFAIIYSIISIVIFYYRKKPFLNILLTSSIWAILCIILSQTPLGAFAFLYGIFVPYPSIMVLYFGLIGLSSIVIAFMLGISLYLQNKRNKWLLLLIVLLMILLFIPANSFVDEKEELGIVVAALQTDEAMEWYERMDNIGKITDFYLGLTRDAANNGARLVVWPEFAINVDITTDIYAPIRNRIELFAKENDVYIIVGSLTYEESGQHQNVALLITPEGLSEQRVGSLNPIFFTEYTVRSENLSYFEVDIDNRTYRIGVLICFEEYYLGEKEMYEDLDILLIMSDSTNLRWGNNVADKYAMFRALQLNSYTIRSVNAGTSQIISYDGRILAKGKRGNDEAIILGI